MGRLFQRGAGENLIVGRRESHGIIELMSGARRHHWIPESYLGVFSREAKTGSQVFVVDCVDRKSFWTSTDNVCVKRDFNRLESPDLDPNELETRLGQFESDAISALREIGAGRATTGSREWVYGLNLMGLIATRNPATRQQLTRAAERVTLKLLQKSLESKDAWEATIADVKAAGALDPSSPVDFERHREFVESGKFSMEFHQNFLILQELRGVMPVIEILGRRTWSLLEAPADSGGFITTDRPVCVFPTDGSTPTAPTRLDDRTNSIVFPVSPRLLACGCALGRQYSSDITRRAVARFYLALLRFSTGRVFGPHERFEFGSSKPELPLVVGRDVLEIVGDFVWYDDGPSESEETATAPAT